MKGLIKFWTLSLGVAVAFMLTACGGGSPKIDSKDLALIKEKYPNSQILSYAEAEKELDKVGLKPTNVSVQKCFEKNYTSSYFIKTADNEIKVVKVVETKFAKAPNEIGTKIEVREIPIGKFKDEYMCWAME